MIRWTHFYSGNYFIDISYSISILETIKHLPSEHLKASQAKQTMFLIVKQLENYFKIASSDNGL